MSNTPKSQEELKALEEQVKQYVKEAEAALQKAVDFADQHGLVFGWYPAYGLGGVYQGKGSKNWNHSSFCSTHDTGPEFLEYGKWVSSSEKC